MGTKSAAPKIERGSARERLLAAADQLFYDEGVNTVGIDRVIEQAGVAKASLYSNFGSKEELVRAYLEERFLGRKQRIEKKLASVESPRQKMLAVFDVLGEYIAKPGYRGCAFVRASAESRSGAGVQGACELSRGYTRTLFTTLAREAGAREPAALAERLVLLYDGAMVSAQMDENRKAARSARDVAEILIDRALAPEPSR
jgi:AcrR family transcriptional regulator